MKLRKNCSELLVLCCWWILAVSVAEVSAGTGDDSVTVGVGGKVLIEVTANDSGAVTIEITDDPEIGTAVIRPGNRILYHHTGAAAGTDTLRYTVRDSSDSLAPATVTVTVSGALRLANTTATLPPDPPPSVFGVVNAFPNIGFWRPTTMESPPGDTKRLFVGEREGKIYLIPGTSAPTGIRRGMKRSADMRFSYR
jgi:hypothetical protein